MKDHEIIDEEPGAELDAAVFDLEEGLIAEGFDPEDVQELLYDPAPKKRKKGKRRKTTNQRSYRSIGTGKKRKTTAKKPKKGLAKIRPWVLPGAAAGTFYAGYITRAKELFAAGKITQDSVFDAIKYDITNFNTTDAMNRLKNNAGEIVTPLLAAALVKEIKPIGKHSGLAADVLSGMGIGVAAKTILDPPLTPPSGRTIQQGTTQIQGRTALRVVQHGQIEQVATNQQIQPQAVAGHNPYL